MSVDVVTVMMSAFRYRFQILQFVCEKLTGDVLEHAVQHIWLILIAYSVLCRLPTHGSVRLTGAAQASDVQTEPRLMSLAQRRSRRQ